MYIHFSTTITLYHLFLAVCFRFRESGKFASISVVDAWHVVTFMRDKRLAGCASMSPWIERNLFFTLVEKQIVPSTRTFIYPWTKLLEIVSSIFTSFGSKLDAAGHLEKFFRVSSRAADRYLCRGNYQRLRWRCGDPTKDKNFGAWASSPQVSRRSVHEKGAASILERIHLRENTW